MQNHQPRLIDQAFPMPGTPDEPLPVQDRLYSPPHPNGALIVRVFDGEDVSAEAERWTAEGYAVLAVQAPQRSMERDEAACAVFLSALESKLDQWKRVFIDGWFAAYAIFHSKRFLAAVQRPALINPSTAYGNCAAGWVDKFGETLEEMMLSLAKQSVLKDVDQCTTPCLVVYTEGNPHYSREQSEQLYAAMKDRNPDVPCRMAVFTPAQWDRHGMNELGAWWSRFGKEARQDAE